MTDCFYDYSKRETDVIPWATLSDAPVYRLMDRQYVDEFFNDGSLRLSSFAKFSEHTDEARHDAHEGVALSTFTDGAMWYGGVTSAGIYAYVLCTTMSPTNEMCRAFGFSGIRIHNKELFAAHVASKIPMLGDWANGLCDYKSGLTLRTELEPDFIKDLRSRYTDSEGNIDFRFAEEMS